MAEVVVEAYQEEGKPDVLSEFLDELCDKNDVKKIRKLIRMLQSQGKDLGFPVSRFLGEGLHELRDRSCGFRIYYTFIGNVLAILLVIGDKSSQQDDIERAKNRRKRLISSRGV